MKAYAAFVLALSIAIAAPRGAAPIRVMLLDGESGGPYHHWQLTTRVLKKELDEAGIFQVDVVTAPPADASFSAFKPDFAKYQVVVLNYDAPDERWPAELKTRVRALCLRRRRARGRPRRPTTRSPVGKRSTT